MLIGFRVLQGLGGGMLMPLGMTIMTRAAGPARMGRLMAILGIPMLLGPICGPILGGWLIEHYSWHWIFLINVPLGIGAVTYAFFALPKDHIDPSESLDVLGVALMSPGLALFLFGISSIPEKGTWNDPKVYVNMLIGAGLMVAFVFHSFRPKHPLLDLRLFRNRNLTVSVITMFLFAAAFFGGLLLVPTYFQSVRGESTLDAGLLVAPQGIGAMLTMPIAGMHVDPIPVGQAEDVMTLALDHVERCAPELHPVAVLRIGAHDLRGHRDAVLLHGHARGQLDRDAARLDLDRAHAPGPEALREHDVVAFAGAEGVGALLHRIAAGKREPAIVLAQALLGVLAPFDVGLLPVGGVGRGGGKGGREGEGEEGG